MSATYQPGRLRSAGSADPVIRISLRSPEQLFNSIDPSPFQERDLDESAERFILNWARDVDKESELRLEVTLENSPELADRRQQITDAVHEQFRRHSELQPASFVTCSGAGVSAPSSELRF